ncbi:serine/threonine-protein kinase [Streptosporangium sp. KLBMP 9127]|nr:serine/threonine protein kinase [Streptosporangium sp. KLBMP 9127]
MASASGPPGGPGRYPPPGAPSLPGHPPPTYPPVPTGAYPIAHPPPGTPIVLTVMWAMVPLLTCGVGTPFIMGHAAARLKSASLVAGAVLYGAGTVVFWGAIAGYEKVEDAPGWLNALMMVGILGSVIGGTVHALLIRSRVFRPVRPAPAPLGVPYGPTASHAPRTAPTLPRGPQGGPQRGPRAAGGAVQPLRATDPGRLGPYRLVGQLGRGGQGVVYLGVAPDGMKVAVKVLHDWFSGDPVAKSRFVREVDAARKVAPFSTARVLDVRMDDDSAYIVSEYVEGRSLERLVQEEGPRAADGLTRLALATAGALAAIHRAGIVHRDFKPANVLIGPDGPRVIDFGIARALDQNSATSGKIVGTPSYMSPEQFAGGDVSPQSDVFSWAATMIFAASGRPAFGDDSMPAIVNRVLNHHPDLACLPPPIRPLIASCLDKRPHRRPDASDIMLGIVH